MVYLNVFIRYDVFCLLLSMKAFSLLFYEYALAYYIVSTNFSKANNK